jgi:hypothetical protein
LPIPLRTVQAQAPYFLPVPLTDAQIAAIEEERQDGPVTLYVWLSGLASQSAIVQPIQNNTTAQSLTIHREHWLTVLEQCGFGRRRLVELPDPRLPRNVQEWQECVRQLEQATQHYRQGEYEAALTSCRKIVEGIPTVLCTAWGLPP